MMATTEESEAGHGQSISQVHGGIQAEGRGAVREVGHDVRRGGTRAGLRRGQPGRLGQEGLRRRAGARRQPVPDGRGPAQAEEGERAVQARERDTFKSERLLRQQAAVGLSAERAKFEFIFSNEPNWPVSGMCAALKAARQGCYAWKSRPPSAHDLRDDELAVAISRVRDEVRGICGAVRGHHLREDPPGLAVSGARDGHMVAAHRGMVDGPEHRGRARRRGIEDSAGQAKPARGMRSSQRLRLAIRVAASVQDHAGERHPAIDGVDLVAVGQRGHGVAHGHREVGMRARAHLRHARGVRAGSVRVHRGNLQQGEDTFGAGLPQPRRVRRC